MGGEDCADTVNSASIRLVRAGITFVVDLLERLIGCSVEFEFKDKHIRRRFDDAIYSTLALLFLNEDKVATYHPQYEIESVLEIPFTISFVTLAAHGIRDIRKKGGKKFAYLLQISIVESLYELKYPTFRIIVAEIV